MVNNSRMLVVGAGGIGCELLKNIVLTGFRNIEVIDLDTIDVSNLNRQFLFHKKHVGQSKAKVARESALSFNPSVKIKAHHDSIMSPEFGVDYFKQFDVVMNALDNRAARNHVNRMCLAADIPLVESGTAGYLGQVTIIRKGVTECYECQPKSAQKTYPGCTIRNTPSEPIHCIVWAKHLFNQLFGEADADEEVSPDTEDPEAAAEAGENALQRSSENGSNGGIQRTSTRAWAEEIGYNHTKLFNKLFCDDIKYLLSMDKLWKKRTPPTPLLWGDALTCSNSDENGVTTGLQDQRVWNIQECANIFGRSVDRLKNELGDKGEDLVWDKDDSASMDFVTCAANIRAHCFGITMKSRFDIKSMAGNIIPAIATTNAVIAGVIVMQALHVLSGQEDKCKTIYLNRKPNPRKKLLVPCCLAPPNPKCYVCAAKPEVTLILNTTAVTVKALEDKILKERFAMVAPDVEIEDGKGTILISSEEGETEENNHKYLSVFGITNGSRLKADDFLQNYELVINIKHVDKLEDDVEFEVQGDLPEPAPAKNNSAVANAEKDKSVTEEVTCSSSVNQEEADDIVMVDNPNPSRKRKADENERESNGSDSGAVKRARTSAAVDDERDELIIL